MPPPIPDSEIIGVRYGRLVVLHETDRTHHRRRRFRVRCDCGKEHSVELANLRFGETKSCGCWPSDRMKTVRPARRHGKSGSRIYNIWTDMIKRCTKPKTMGYANYGGRGIRVCPEWRASFATFLRDMGDAPRPWTLERVDVDGDYCPSNCIWATKGHQMRNTRRTIHVEINGQTKCLSEWCRDYGANYFVAHQRIKVLKWEPVRALTQPVSHRGPVISNR